jgi:predicted methyltransferase MtxX (methanogen marker protein 4)
VSKGGKVGHGEPILHGRGMFVDTSPTVEGRLSYCMIRTLKVGADEKQDIEDRFEIMGNTMRIAMNK